MFDAGQHFNAVIDDENLPVSSHLQINRLFDDVFVFDRDQLRLNGVTVRRRSGHDAQIPCTEQRELQGPRNRCRRQRQDIYVCPQFFQFLLGCDTEFLFLVDDQQS